MPRLVNFEIIFDEGPLVELLNERDTHNGWVRAQRDMIESPLTSCEPAVNEMCFLARLLVHSGLARVLGFVRRIALDLSFPLAHEIGAIARLAAKYRDRRMSRVDRCLVRMSEVHRSSSDLGLRLHELPKESAAADSDSVLQPLFPLSHPPQ